jgi:hypothetical protein
MIITKEDFSDRVIELMKKNHELFNFCPSQLGLKDTAFNCTTGTFCEDCFKQAIEQGVEK